MSAGLDRRPRVAVVDGGSFVLPYDHELVKALAGQGRAVSFWGSATRYNAEVIEAMRSLPGVVVRSLPISGSVSSRMQGVFNYLRLWLGLWRVRGGHDLVNLQFSVLWPLELPFLLALRRKLVYTVHNAVPHGFEGRQHRPTRWIATLARRLVFASEFSRADFLRRYGERFAAKAAVLPHGLLPLAPELPPVAYRPLAQPQALVYWSTVKPYKGVELFATLARCERIRASGLSLEVYGAWSAELQPLREELRSLGVKIVDRYLDVTELIALTAREVLFVLPYREASQSGALYALVHHGCTFACTDVGDLGDFTRRFGLEALLLRERSCDAMVELLARLGAEAEPIARALQSAQDRSAWRAQQAALDQAYGPA